VECITLSQGLVYPRTPAVFHLFSGDVLNRPEFDEATSRELSHAVKPLAQNVPIKEEDETKKREGEWNDCNPADGQLRSQQENPEGESSRVDGQTESKKQKREGESNPIEGQPESKKQKREGPSNSVNGQPESKKQKKE